ncbi:hypothetical protein E8D34_15325 [Nocardioides sp. GY 10113]|uniref:hypothetical protein n=1 Tax=Nocardioides sp. GY 10113 TaxID=2569761 RepID=UPI0010A81192|nr:hypothetical protein [Nocardioides sp. GY 10113]TIC83920.1 hypothetical protein E8D34_15325 [Nocardioides sp. GY 10113]
MTDWGAVYAANATALEHSAPGWDEDVLATRVPASPEWTVLDVLRHLAASGTDAANGQMADAGSPAWTARHLASRADRSVAELLEEIAGNVGPLADQAEDTPTPAMVWDIAVHHADLHEALGLGRLPERMWLPIVRAAAPRFLAEQPVTIRSGDTSYGAGGPELAIEPYELFRVLFSRRSVGQIAAWAGDALDPATLGVFGPREDDQPVPDA